MPPPIRGGGITSCAGSATICPRPCDLDLWPFDLESGVRVTCDVGYLCANFSLPRPLCCRLSHDVRDRQTDKQTDRQIDRRQTASLLNAPAYGAVHNNQRIYIV